VLVVVDELAAAGNQEATFEQHWHIAPGLAAPSSGQTPHRFAVSGGGGLTVAFGEQADVTINPEGEGSCLCRTLRMKKGLAVSVFQWSAEAASLHVQAKGQSGNWSLAISGAGFAGTLSLAEGELRYSPQTV
ncbi:MAG TPA: hypothetical protein VHE09_03830, partial [Rhizomicrobium sp.]|nr:hypothetical protein [Rhizomicrobium sp.]